MSNTNHIVAMQRARSRAHLQARLVKQRLACRCGGTKDNEKMMVCLACFQAAPLAMQRDAYSRVPEVRRTAMRQLLSRAESRKAERQLSGGPADAINRAAMTAPEMAPDSLCGSNRAVRPPVSLSTFNLQPSTVTP